MWVPTTNELLSEHVATNVVDPSDYAISGLGQNRLTAEQIDEMLLRFDIYASIKRVDPKSYAAILAKVTEAFQQGETMSDVAGVVFPIVDEVFSNSLPYTSSEALQGYIRFKTTELIALNEANPSECYFMINPDQADEATRVNFQNEHRELNEREAKFKAAVIDGFSGIFQLPSDNETKPLLSFVFAKLQARRDFDQNLFSTKFVAPGAYEHYCSSFVAFYEETLKLPQNESVKLLRHLFAPN
jgi:hypothetical protein